ncbi:ABC transporter substrate-binding protein [Cohnella lubricantis]|uniref:Carbohydrate ABC transporter substrate-binding protein n=1 Tax=Cohnella lubricantis TaxID=2163172 RepID=A0A841TG16_9BACL|nr:ABC transporter substrate-binding protein [Cohnella lubricantis]MBB6678879.1 carbohydrate ABC transporter substrate-binding protein [Cohnella lubricantis]MBP2120204.1 ABC-type glycerol-3-phosphate transport system substrate-binding protein [Cohnella lubricantis]
MRKLVTAIMVCSLSLIGSGCSRPQPEPVTITVNYPSSQQFYKMYGYAFEEAHPNITVQVVPDLMKGTDSPPSTDVVYMNSQPLFEQRIERGELIRLDSLIRQSKFQIDSMTPIVTSMLKSAGNGELYGLAATFQSDALFYNKRLFNEYQVPYPHDQMSWDEVLELAERFPHQNNDGMPLYGMQMNFYKNVSFNYILDMGATEGLSYIDPNTLKITMNTEKWERIWNVAVSAFQSGSIYDKGEDAAEESVGHPPFYMEQAAMTKASFITAYNFEPFSQYQDGRTIEWGVVTVPVDPSNSTLSHSYSIFDIYGISSSASHQQEAWELIQFIAGDSKNNHYLTQANVGRGLPVNLDDMKPIPGHDLSPLYRLLPADEPVNPYLLMDASILDSFADAAQQILDEAIAGEITIEEALERVEREGQSAVDEARNKLTVGGRK